MNEEFRMVPAGARAIWFLRVLAVIFLGVAGMFAFTAYSCRHVQYEVSSSSLRISGQYGRTIPVEDLTIEEARRVDFGREPGLRPVSRTNGIGLPGFLAGWVRLRNGEKGLVFLTDPSRVVAIPTRSGYTLELSVTEPDAFLAALRLLPRSTASAPRQVFQMVPAEGPAVWFCVGLTGFMLLMVWLLVWVARFSQNVSYQVGAFGLRITGLYGRTIPATSLVTELARPVNLYEERTMQPVMRTNGTGLPGFLAGWVRLANREKALVFLTGGDRVLYVPTREGFCLLLSVNQPEALLASLRRHAA